MRQALATIFGCSVLALALIQPGWAKVSGKDTTQTITGCLAQGDEANEFSIKAEDGKAYGLRSPDVKLAEHLNHKVTVTGKVTPAKHAGKVGKNGRREEDEHMRVSSLTMVSPTCQ